MSVTRQQFAQIHIYIRCVQKDEIERNCTDDETNNENGHLIEKKKTGDIERCVH